jgi:uracil-DNA glycosylase family 4
MMAPPPFPLPRAELARRLEAHCTALAACRRCAYEDPTVVPILSAAGSPRAMLVGQAPGKVERGDHRPFAGRAGKTLFRWLARAGVDEETARARIYIAAITRCYPGPSPTGRGDRVPSRRERELCREWLDAELRLIQPVVLIPVGRLAIERFLGARPLHELVGREHEVRHVGGTSRAIPLPHPSGASTWVNMPANRVLLERALRLLGHELAALGVGAGWQGPPGGERRAGDARAARARALRSS